jgi:hypothetical protein
MIDTYFVVMISWREWTTGPPDPMQLLDRRRSTNNLRRSWLPAPLLCCWWSRSSFWPALWQWWTDRRDLLLCGQWTIVRYSSSGLSTFCCYLVRRSDFDLDKKAAGLILPIPWKQKRRWMEVWAIPVYIMKRLTAEYWWWIPRGGRWNKRLSGRCVKTHHFHKIAPFFFSERRPQPLHLWIHAVFYYLTKFLSYK